MRRFLTALLGLVAALVIVLTTASWWAHQTVLDAERFQDVVAPMAKDPAVQALVAKQTVAAVEQSVADSTANTTDLIQILVNRLVQALRPQLEQGVANALNSEAFNTAWTKSTTAMQRTFVAVARGEDLGPAQMQSDQIVIDVDPLAKSLLEPITSQLPPEVTDRIQVDLPDIVIPTGPAVDNLRQFLRIADLSVIVLAALSVALPLLVLVLARRRVRSLAWLAATVAVLAAVAWFALRATPGLVQSAGKTPEQGNAIAALTEAFTSPLTTWMLVLFGGSLTVAAVAGYFSRTAANDVPGSEISSSSNVGLSA